MKDIQQLIKKENNQEYKDIYPKTFTDAVLDKHTGANLADILNSFNMYFIAYAGSKEITRVQVPTNLRRKGLWITYIMLDDTIVTEYYNGSLLTDDAWQDSANWINSMQPFDKFSKKNMTCRFDNFTDKSTSSKLMTVKQGGEIVFSTTDNRFYYLHRDVLYTYWEVKGKPANTEFQYKDFVYTDKLFLCKDRAYVMYNGTLVDIARFTIDKELSLTSNNPIANSTVTKKINEVNADTTTALTLARELKEEGRFQINGNVTNNPDEEDITVEENKLKFKDKVYNAGEFSGLGRVYLRKNIVNGKNVLTQEMINKPNTIYIIQYDYDLDNEEINIPENCTLQFEGGSFKNGTLNGNNTKLKYNKFKFLININIKGNFNIPYIDSNIFKNEKNNIFNNVIALSDDNIYNIIVINEECVLNVTNAKSINIKSNTSIYINANMVINDNNQSAAYGITIGNDNYIVNNVCFNGGGYILTGNLNHPDTDNTQWSHGIIINNAENIIVKNICIKECWGDGLDVLGNSKNVIINNVIADSNRRQGFSIISGENIKLINCKGINTGSIKFTSPGAGLDIEPNEGEYVKNIYILNCEFYNNYTPSEKIITDLQVFNSLNNDKDNIVVENSKIGGLWIGSTNSLTIKNCDIKIGLNIINTTLNNIDIINTNIIKVDTPIKLNNSSINLINSYVNNYYVKYSNTFYTLKKSIKVTLKNAKTKVFTIDWNIIGMYPSNIKITYNTVSTDYYTKNIFNTVYNSINKNIQTKLTLISSIKFNENDAYFYIYPNSNENSYKIAIDYDLYSISNLYNNNSLNPSDIIFEELEEKPINVDCVPIYNILEIGDSVESVIDNTMLHNGSFIFDKSIYKPLYYNKNKKQWIDAMNNPYNALKKGTTAQRPTGVQIGFTYKDTDLNKWIIWNGEAWENIDGTALG